MKGTTPTVDLPRSKVRVIKPNPDTGEIIERVIPHSDFRPKAPRRPRIDFVRRDLLSPSRQVLYMFAHREGEIAFWEHHAHILTREERHDFLHDGARSVLRPLKPGWKPGDRMFVAANMEAEVLEVSESPRGYGTVFMLIDWREILLKRSPGGGSKPETDEDGYAAPVTEPEKRRAQIDGAYTTSATLAVPDAGAVMDEAAFERVHADRDQANAMRRGRKKVTQTRASLERRLEEARAKNQRSTVRYLQRQLGLVLGEEDRAA